MTLARTRKIATALAGTVLFASGLVTVATPAVADGYDPSTPPYSGQFADPNDVDTLAIYDASSGARVTSGDANAALSSYYFVSSRDWNPDHTKAALFGNLAEANKAQGAWSGQGLSATTTYPVTTAPSPVADAGTRPTARGGSTNSFAKLAQAYPNLAPSSSPFFQLYQVRVKTTFPTPQSTAYASADVAIDPAAGTWTLLRPIPRAGAPTTAKLEVSPRSPQVVGTAVTASTSVLPADVPGTVAFTDGTASLGPPVAVSNGVASSSLSLPAGTHSLLATFTPADTGAFQPSSSNPISFVVSDTGSVPDPPVPTVTAGDGSATLVFRPANPRGSAITSYIVTATSTGPPVTKTVMEDGTLADPLSDTITLTLDGLTNGTTYGVTVAATNSLGTGAASDAVTVVPAGAVAPGAPTAVTASPADGSASVSWTGPESTGGSPITGYTVTATPASGPAVTVAVPASATSGLVSGLTNDTTYAVTVSAVNAAGTGPASSPAVTVTPSALTPPGAPTDVFTSAFDSAVGVTWTAPTRTGGIAVTGYTVSAAAEGRPTITKSLDTTNTFLAGLLNGVTYTVTVVARNDVGSSVPSTPVAVTPATVPDAVTGVAATVTSGSARVSWVLPSSDGGSPITGYAVTAIPVSAGTALTAQVTGGLSTTLTGLVLGTPYTVSVVANNAFGSGPVSQAVTVTSFVRPGAPGRPVVQGGDRAALVSFGAAAPNGSRVTRYTAVASPGGMRMSGVASPLLVSGLSNGLHYTFTVVATNAAGSGPASAPSGVVTPAPRTGTHIVLTRPAVVDATRRFAMTATVVGLTGSGSVVLSSTPAGGPTTTAIFPVSAGRERLLLTATRTTVYRIAFRGDLGHGASAVSFRMPVRAYFALNALTMSGRTATVTGRVLPALAGRTVELIDVRSGVRVVARTTCDAAGRVTLRGAVAAGTARLQVRSAGDATHLPGASVVLVRSVV